MTNGMSWILGMMSGTSLDGVDAALIQTDGIKIEAFGRCAYRAYSGNESAILHAALGHWPGDEGVNDAAMLSVLSHAELVSEFPEAGLIGYHGQTLAHDPGGRGTHQAGSGAELARLTGRPVVWDFRTEDVRQGGQGAPLAPFFHWACADWAIRQNQMAPLPTVFLNLGGVGNLTWIDPLAGGPETGCLAFDTGPANAPINDMMRVRRLGTRDEGGQLASRGKADDNIVKAFLQHPYFLQTPPKSLDRDSFSELSQSIEPLSDENAAATLVAVLTGSVAMGFMHLPTLPARVLVSGGGRLNKTVMSALSQALSCPVEPVEAVGLDGDMLEAQAFGWLAMRVLRGLPTSGPKTTAAPELISGGRISPPPYSGA